MDAERTRDSVAKAIYARLFDAVVAAVNAELQAVSGAVEAANKGASAEDRSIGLLDLFGFEAFQINSFEQAANPNNSDAPPDRFLLLPVRYLLHTTYHLPSVQLNINYANEKLQQFFVYCVFQAEEAVHREDGVFWPNVILPDNRSYEKGCQLASPCSS